MNPDWPTTVAEAEAIQDRLRGRVDTTSPGPAQPRTVAGLDVAYSGVDGWLAAAVVVLDTSTLEVIDEVVAVGQATFPYVPGLFAFRELPTLLTALDGLSVTPELLVCDGQGVAHPRRFGLASHVGLRTGIPTIGVAKTLFVGEYEEPGPERGAWSPLTDQGEVIGRVLRTRAGVKPVFVSVGHRISLPAASARVLELCRTYRLPETTRRADQCCRAALKAHGLATNEPETP